MKRSLLVIALVWMLYLGGAAFAQSEDDAATTLQTSPSTMIMPPFEPDPLTDSITWWGYRYRRYLGDHSLEVGGGLSSYGQSLAYGDNVATGAFTQSVAYRYHGLFGGVIRPVARVTLTGGQDLRPLDADSFRGYQTGYYGLVIPEAGVEIVYKGYGIGMTAAYPMQVDFSTQIGNEDVEGPPLPDAFNPGEFKWENLWKNFYLIVE